MGGNSSKLEKALAECPEDERYYGFENFGNTCYANSVLQALYFCRPFREKVLQYANDLPKDYEESLLNCLAELFVQISSQRKKTGAIPPKKFVQRLKKDNELFRSYMHQDAHEFLNYLLNQICENLESERKQREDADGSSSSGPAPAAATAGPSTRYGTAGGAAAANGGAPAAAGAGGQPSDANGHGNGKVGTPTWVHDIFQGRLVNETRCLQCETVTSREEVFMDLSLEIEQNCSLTSCLRNFSATEMLDKDDKFFCDNCCCLQEAQKRMKIKQLPTCLILHLKRFKYIESLNRMRKLMHRVVFPYELRLSNTTEDAEGADALYSLFAVVVHVGSGPHHGHYVALIKSHSNWLFFDDDTVESIAESMVQAVFGATQEFAQHMDHGYILFYEKTTTAAAAS